jgi:predicted nucleic acid-binding protein
VVHVQETGTVWVTGITNRSAGHDLNTVSLTGPEMIATFFRKARGGIITRVQAARLARNFSLDWQQQYQVLIVNEGIINLAMTIAERYALRGYDSVHLAAALELHQNRQAIQLPALTFVSADVEQLQAAQAEGLVIENPDNYT